MSHELRTPMNGVVGMTELLTRTALSSTQVRLTQTIRSSAQVLLQIVNDLLDLSKIQAGKVELECLPLDLPRLLEECTTLFAGAAEAKGVELIVCPPLEDGRTLVGDPLRVRQILMNLVGNAVKFTMQGEVVVKADVDATQSDRAAVRITVADTGVGMDAATIAKIFEPFTQADESTTRRFGGSGLGLAICRELAELLGGSVTVESRPNVGSTFHVALSLAVAAGGQPAAAIPAHAAPHPAAIGGHVLLVEDEPVNAAVAQGYLSALGCTHAWVENGPEAIARSATEQFDLIMMDLNMPTMDGFATTRLIRQREGTRHVPIIALTAHDAKNYRALCLDAGMNDLLSKPYTLDQCAQLLRRWLDSARGGERQDVVPVPRHGESQSGADSPSPLAALSDVDATAVAGLRNLRAGAHVDLYSKLVDLFRAGSTDAIAQIKAQLEADELRAASGVCHKLASSAANVGALAFARDVRRLEKICDEGDKPRAQRLCDRLAAAHPALLQELIRLQLRATA
jgi:CheY-like chemotaxis protein/HPt (histidine-containing phosphotransfer) domain-containing protein